MAEAIATGLATDAIKNLGLAAWKKIKNDKNLDPCMKKLQFLKSFLKGLLQHIEPSKVRSDNDKHMLEMLQRLEDTVDSLLVEGANIIERKEIMDSSGFRKVRHLILYPKQILSPSRFVRKYNAFIDELESIKPYFHLIESFFKDSYARNQNQGFSVDVVVGPLITEVVIGRDRDRDNIIPLLCDSSNGQESISVAAIVGIGGQGKTTLAKYVCNDQRVKGCFDVMLWVSCTPYSSFTNIVGDILTYVNDMKPLSLNCGMAQLHPQFLHARSAFEGKKCLLVLDNIWYQDNLRAAWVTLKTSLGVRGCLGASGSTVLITSRSEAVARIMDTPKPYMLNGLAKSDSLLLLQHFARVKGQDPGMEAIEKEIVQLCPKVPLVLKNIGCQLAQRHSIGEWQAFKDKLASTSTCQVDDKVLEALKHSYDQLDEKLQLCATYCSLFSRRRFERDTMVLYWMALGFVGSEDDGEECIVKLADHGFLEVIRCGTWFELHDVMYELITWIGKSEHQKIDSKTKGITKGVCHVSLDSQLKEWDVLRSKFICGEQLQSIVVADHDYGFFLCKSIKSLSDVEYIISNFPHLRVLELCDKGMGKVPTSVGDLIHLRHLKLSRNPLRKLPNSITKLVNLLSLDLSGCKNLEELPKDMGNLVKLRHLWVGGCNLRYMPKGFGNLTDLQTLDLFVVGEKRRSSRGSKSKAEGAKLEELGRLNSLKGSLLIYVGGESKDIISEAREAQLENKTQLTSLEVLFKKRAEEDEKFLEGLQPNGKRLKSLLISNYGGKRLPMWITGDRLHQRFPKLEVVYIFCCDLMSPMSPILPVFGPCLRKGVLQIMVDDNEGDLLDQWVPGHSRLRKLLEMGSVGVRFTTHDADGLIRADFSDLAALQIDRLKIARKLAPRSSLSGQIQPDVLLQSCFSNLNELILIDIPELEIIPEEFQNFSSLSTIRIYRCPNLKGIPDWIHSLSSLTKIHIYDALEMKVLSNSIGSMIALRDLRLVNCPGLESLPHQISNLHESCRLEINGCSKALFEKCGKPTGEYWPYLQHLHHLLISSSEGDTLVRHANESVDVLDRFFSLSSSEMFSVNSSRSTFSHIN